MAIGSITSLGLGSGLELQNILDQLKDVEKAPIRSKETQKDTLEKKVSAFNSVNAKLFSMKSNALSLSLESDFLKNNLTVSDEAVLSGRVSDGVAGSVNSVEVVSKARANSWESTGVGAKNAVIYPAPETNITSVADAVTSGPDTMTIKYGADGAQTDIDIDLDGGMTIAQIVDAVNGSTTNQDSSGNRLVTASVEKNSSSQYYIRLKATNGGNRADSQISVQGFDYIKNDTTIAIAKVNDTGGAAYMSIPPGATYEEAAGIINNASNNPGVTASLIDDGTRDTPFRLVLTAKQTGEENRFAVQNLPMTEVIGKDDESLNAKLTVNGVTYQRQANDGIDDIISGVSFNIKKTGDATLSVQNDMDGIKQHILDLVGGLNELSEQIKGTEEEEDSDNPLQEDYAVKRMMTELKSLLGTVVPSDNAYTSLFDLGLAIDQDGVVTLDETRLDQAIAADPDGIKNLFIGKADDNIQGLGDIINDGITRMISQGGSISTEIDAAEQKITRLDDSIQAATERLERRYQTMTQQFVRLDTYINQLNNEAGLLTSLIDSIDNQQNKK
jgi:flagellar hook-associated protein 2